MSHPRTPRPTPPTAAGTSGPGETGPAHAAEELRAAVANERQLREQIEKIRRAVLAIDEHVEARAVLQSIADHARVVVEIGRAHV